MELQFYVLLQRLSGIFFLHESSHTNSETVIRVTDLKEKFFFFIIRCKDLKEKKSNEKDQW